MRKRKETITVNCDNVITIRKRLEEKAKSLLFRKELHSIILLPKYEGEVNYLYSIDTYMDNHNADFRKLYSKFTGIKDVGDKINYGKECDKEMLQVIEKEKPDNIRLSFYDEDVSIYLEKEILGEENTYAIDMFYSQNLKDKILSSYLLRLCHVIIKDFNVQCYWNSSRLQQIIEYQQEEGEDKDKYQEIIQKYEFGSQGKLKHIIKKAKQDVFIGYYGECIECIDLLYNFLKSVNFNLYDYYPMEKDISNGQLWIGDIIFIQYTDDIISDMYWEDINEIANNIGIACCSIRKELFVSEWSNEDHLKVFLVLIDLLNKLSIKIFKGYGIKQIRTERIADLISNSEWRELYGIFEGYYGKDKRICSLQSKYIKEFSKEFTCTDNKRGERTTS